MTKDPDAKKAMDDAFSLRDPKPCAGDTTGERFAEEGHDSEDACRNDYCIHRMLGANDYPPGAQQPSQEQQGCYGRDVEAPWV
ncbi:hypothetical protein [Nesterenkonia flava]|uniref:hypothetical protein n=1 Tax=Nesterenkonia flava TaxID=469799 RepID=UPI00286E9421|nr:hypothetical protein [Nesterenkonia flava]